MNEVFYNIKLFIGFTIIMSFVLYWNIKLQSEANFHSNDFGSIDSNFSISTGSENNEIKNTIFINTSSPCYNSGILLNCENEKKYSINCLYNIKQNTYGYYNGLYYKPSNNLCR